MTDKLIGDLPHVDPETLNGAELIEIQKGSGAGSSKHATVQELFDATAGGSSFAADIGDGSAASFTVEHGLGTRDVHVTVYRNATPWDTVLTDVARPDTANVVVSGFGTAPSAGQFRVLVRKN